MNCAQGVELRTSVTHREELGGLLVYIYCTCNETTVVGGHYTLIQCTL